LVPVAVVQVLTVLRVADVEPVAVAVAATTVVVAEPDGLVYQVQKVLFQQVVRRQRVVLEVLPHLHLALQTGSPEH
jgi:hypothetical protein